LSCGASCSCSCCPLLACLPLPLKLRFKRVGLQLTDGKADVGLEAPPAEKLRGVFQAYGAWEYDWAERAEGEGTQAQAPPGLARQTMTRPIGNWARVQSRGPGQGPVLALLGSHPPRPPSPPPWLNCISVAKSSRPSCLEAAAVSRSAAAEGTSTEAAECHVRRRSELHRRCAMRGPLACRSCACPRTGRPQQGAC